MQYKFFPHTQEEITQMLDRIGAKSLEDLYAEVPNSIHFDRDYHLPEAKSEIEIRQLFEKLGQENQQLTVFAGAGV